MKRRFSNELRAAASAELSAPQEIAKNRESRSSGLRLSQASPVVQSGPSPYPRPVVGSSSSSSSSSTGEQKQQFCPTSQHTAQENAVVAPLGLPVYNDAIGAATTSGGATSSNTTLNNNVQVQESEPQSGQVQVGGVTETGVAANGNSGASELDKMGAGTRMSFTPSPFRNIGFGNANQRPVSGLMMQKIESPQWQACMIPTPELMKMRWPGHSSGNKANNSFNERIERAAGASSSPSDSPLQAPPLFESQSSASQPSQFASQPSQYRVAGTTGPSSSSSSSAFPQAAATADVKIHTSCSSTSMFLGGGDKHPQARIPSKTGLVGNAATTGNNLLRMQQPAASFLLAPIGGSPAARVAESPVSIVQTPSGASAGNNLASRVFSSGPRSASNRFATRQSAEGNASRPGFLQPSQRGVGRSPENRTPVGRASQPAANLEHMSPLLRWNFEGKFGASAGDPRAERDRRSAPAVPSWVSPVDEEIEEQNSPDAEPPLRRPRQASSPATMSF
ncbi:unnamed protein product [Amoebophrya sp. A25]|nr:unnamed protein product [Amoebophrya sp. A25]|eukprot:GSA25T00005176001.1